MFVRLRSGLGSMSSLYELQVDFASLSGGLPDSISGLVTLTYDAQPLPGFKFIPSALPLSVGNLKLGRLDFALLCTLYRCLQTPTTGPVNTWRNSSVLDWGLVVSSVSHPSLRQ